MSAPTQVEHDRRLNRAETLIRQLQGVAESGVPGPVGPQGPTGPAGPEGPHGDTGPPGPQGTQGIKGDKGDTGAQGPQGTQGTQGPQGVKGDTGATGAQGVKGDPGATGATGSQGPIGPAGPTGPTGPQGPAGAGALVQDEGAALAQRASLNFIGAGVTASDDAANNRTNVTVPDPNLTVVLPAAAQIFGSTAGVVFQTIGSTAAEIQDRGGITLRLTIPAHPTVATTWLIGGGCLLDAGASVNVWVMPEIGIWDSPVGAMIGLSPWRGQLHSTMAFTGQVYATVPTQLIIVNAGTSRQIRLVGRTQDATAFRAISGSPPVPYLYAHQVSGPIVH